MRRHWYLLLPLVAVIIAAGLATLLPRRHTTTEQHNEQQTTPPLTVSPAPSPPGAAKKPAAPSDGAATLAPAPREGTDARPVAPVPETEDQKPPRLLWEIKAGGGPDFFTEILPAGDMLVGIRNGALYCLEARTGKIIWKYPDNGEGWRTCAAGCIPVPQLIGIVGDEVIAPLPEGQLADRAAGCTGFRLSDGAMMHRHTVGTGYTHEVVPNSGSRVAFAQYERRPPAAPPLRDQPVVA
ncbi:MAG: hypothetical protein NTW87_06105, partial [Planctomycetota bacterium]|nr:hypothetical protein [Planctomycetota bacterium]